MKPVRVLHVVAVDKENYYLRNLHDYSDQGAVDYCYVTFAASESGFVVDFKNRGWDVDALNINRSRLRLLFGFPKLLSAIRRHRPDVIHTHLFEPSLLGLTAAKLMGIPTVLTRHHSDAVHSLSSSVKRKFYLGLEWYVNLLSDRIIAPSKMVRTILTESERVPAEKVTLIPYGQSWDRFSAITDNVVSGVRRTLQMDNTLSLVCVSRLFHRKGHIDLFKALARLGHRKFKLFLVGEGNHRNQLEREAKELGIDQQVHFLGWRDDALAIIAASDILVHPSLEDALSSAVIEALMLEKPIVATDISGVRDSLGDGNYGVIVPPGDFVALCDAIEEISTDLASAQDRARLGRKHILSYMDAKEVARKHQVLYESFSS